MKSSDIRTPQEQSKERERQMAVADRKRSFQVDWRATPIATVESILSHDPFIPLRRVERNAHSHRKSRDGGRSISFDADSRQRLHALLDWLLDRKESRRRSVAMDQGKCGKACELKIGNVRHYAEFRSSLDGSYID